MAVLVTAIHADGRRAILRNMPEPDRVDGRVKPGQDTLGACTRIFHRLT